MNSAIIHKLVHTQQSLTDDEVQQSLDYYNKLDQALSPCPPEYMLVLHDVRKRLERLNEIKRARQAGKDWAAKRPRYPTTAKEATVSVRV